jgi:asparagine synthase (glutamine-hydrolysing)
VCGIVGAADLIGRRVFLQSKLLRMARAISHRGPDDEYFHIEPGIALAARRLAIIDIAGGRQPISNETGDIWTTFEGELFEYPELREQLLKRGHRFATRCDTEAWVHLYEELGEAMFQHARGQFSVAVWDRTTRTLLLGRDRAGIGPLYYTKHDGWLMWASEIKALLASGMIHATADVRGIDYFFNYFCMPTERTCFEQIRMLAPGHYARVKDGSFSCHQYWDLDFPDCGEEKRFKTPDLGAQELEHRLRGAVRKRLVGEVPLSCYLSGGLDSTIILKLSSEERGQPIPSFTIGLDNSGPFNERSKAEESARHIGSPLTIIDANQHDIMTAFPRLITASEGPVLDTSAACTMMLADANRRAGNTIALTGEGADELLAGYVWFKWNRRPQFLNNSGAPFTRLIAQAMSWIIGGGNTHRPPFCAAQGVRFAQQIAWEMIAQSRETLYSREMWERLDTFSAVEELPLSADRLRRWHPLNQSLYAAFKIMLPGLLLNAKGDRVLRQASTEGRYPFLDEDVVQFCSDIAPAYKLKGWTDKWLLRQVAARILPPAIADRRKTMFRANLSRSFLAENRLPWVDQLLSPESLKVTGYFDPIGVQLARQLQAQRSRGSLRRFSLDMGLVGVISTQLWHHLFVGGGLADIPVWTAPESTSEASRVVRSFAVE